MSRILISTSCRYTPHNQSSGHLFVFDYNERKILKTCKIIEPPYRKVDPNPRGGFRGLKGISINDNKIAIANASTIFIYDSLWNPITYIWHPSCAGIHDLILINNNIWVTSSRNDLVICFDLDGKIIKYYDVRKLQPVKSISTRKIYPLLSRQQVTKGQWNFRDPRTHDMAITDSLHVNSLAFLPTGDLLISCGLFREISHYKLHKINNFLKKNTFLNFLPRGYQKIKKRFYKNSDKKFNTMPISVKETSSAVIRLDHENEASLCLIFQESLMPSHSIRLLQDNSAIYLNTSSGDIIHFIPETCQILSSTHIGKKFLRGAIQLPDNSLLVGDNNEIIHFDMIKKRVISRTKISTDVNQAIFDVNILPDHFKEPPESFCELHEQKMPVLQK